MMASTHTYDLPGALPTGASNKRMDPGAVEMALNPDEVDLIDSDALQVKMFSQKIKKYGMEVFF